MFRRFQSCVLNGNCIEINSCNTKVLNGNCIEINFCNTKELPEGNSVVMTKNRPVIDNVAQISEVHYQSLHNMYSNNLNARLLLVAYLLNRVRMIQ